MRLGQYSCVLYMLPSLSPAAQRMKGLTESLPSVLGLLEIHEIFLRLSENLGLGMLLSTSKSGLKGIYDC